MHSSDDEEDVLTPEFLKERAPESFSRSHGYTGPSGHVSRLMSESLVNPCLGYGWIDITKNFVGIQCLVRLISKVIRDKCGFLNISVTKIRTQPKYGVDYEMKNVTEEEDKTIKKYYKDYIRPFVRVGPAGYLLMAGYKDAANDIYNINVRSDDIWVTSFSRSGTTWLQEVVWLVANNLDFEGIKQRTINNRYAFIEYPTQTSEITKPSNPHGPRATIDDYRTLVSLPSPRYVKTHLPLSLLPPKLLDTAKVFYIARDPRDVVVSFHFAHKLFRYFDDNVTLKEFWDLFKNDLIMHTPLFPHVKEAWDRRDHPNLLFLFYEDMQKDILSSIDKVCKFLGKEYSREQKMLLAEHVSFDNMKKNTFFKPSTTAEQNEKTFFRKGKSGGWVEYFDEEMKKEAEEYIYKNMRNTDMRYPEPKS